MNKKQFFQIKDKKPELFEKTDSNIWTDPYIRQQMLKEHLNPISDGATRSKISVGKIIDFITTHAKPDSNLLDLGCGPGIYTSNLKDKGFDVTGIDFNQTSIDYAKQQRDDIHYIQGDYIREYPNDHYDVVIMIYCDMGTHSDKDRDILLNHIYNSLSDNGILIFDVFTEDIILDRKEEKNWDYAPNGGFWNENEYLLLNQIFHYPTDKAYATQYNLITKEESKHFIIWDRYYSEDEITGILKDIGFRDITVKTNLLNSNNFTSANEMFVVARK